MKVRKKSHCYWVWIEQIYPKVFWRKCSGCGRLFKRECGLKISKSWPSGHRPRFLCNACSQHGPYSEVFAAETLPFETLKK